MDNAVSGRSASRSVPDSGIDPDDVSITSSVTEYLSQIGIKENKVAISFLFNHPRTRIQRRQCARKTGTLM